MCRDALSFSRRRNYYLPLGQSFFFGLHNLLCVHLVAQYHETTGDFDRGGGAARISAELEKPLAKTIDSLVAREVASFLWRSTKRFQIPEPVHAELQYLHTY